MYRKFYGASTNGNIRSLYKIVTEFQQKAVKNHKTNDGKKRKTLAKGLKWDQNKTKEYSNALLNAVEEIRDIKQRIEAGLIDSSGKKIQELLINAAKRTMQQKSKKKTNRPIKTKKWFDKQCYQLKLEIRKLGRDKNNIPWDTLIREKYHDKLKQYKQCCHKKRNQFWHNNFKKMEESLGNSKQFWDTWKNCSESYSEEPNSSISGDLWVKHFSLLHTEKRNLEVTENNNLGTDEDLNTPFTNLEMVTTIKKP